MTRYLQGLIWLMVLLAAPLAQAGTKHYYYTDPQGTPLAKADAQGIIVARYEYTPYGMPVSSVGAAPDGLGYTGHVNDPETGLVYMQARYYDAEVGRFLSVDPVTAYDKPMGAFNRYWYANNNPYRYTDPDGRFAQLVWGAVAGAAVEVFVQTAIQGKSFSEIDVSNVAIAAGAGAVTGGIASASALAAARSTISVGTAVARTSATAGAMGTAGSVAEDIANGETPSATKALVEGGAAAVGGAAGARLTLAPLAKLEGMSAQGGLATTVADTTRAAIVGSDKAVVSATTSGVGAKAGETANVTIEAVKTRLQDEIQ